MGKSSLNISIDSEVKELIDMKVPNKSQICENAFRIYLGLESMDEITLNRRIVQIEDNIKAKEVELELLKNKLKETKSLQKYDITTQERNKALRVCERELRDTGDISRETLENNATIIGVHPEELKNKIVQMVYST